MEEEKGDNLEPFACRLEPDQVAFILELTKRRVMGSKKSAVTRAIISYAMQQMAANEHVQKLIAMREAARKG